MPTAYVGRTIPTTPYTLTRLGGAYLTNSVGDYIVTSLGQKIICLVPGGTLRLNDFTGRTIPANPTYTPRTPI